MYKTRKKKRKGKKKNNPLLSADKLQSANFKFRKAQAFVLMMKEKKPNVR